jgi:7-cyano-7-deazaguanine reductase
MPPTDDEPHGTRMIREARLEAIDNRRPDRDYTIHLTIPEFTCLCPRSGFPDFATLFIRYVPGPRCVELRSLKLYVNGFRDRPVFHEDVVNLVLDDLVALLEPRYCEVVGDFNVRGNIHTVVRALHRAQGWAGEPLPWWQDGGGSTDGFPTVRR